MANLIRLPSGAWVRPETVTSIAPLGPSTDLTGENHLPRVVICFGHSIEVVDFPGMDEARDFADRLARDVNGAADA